MNKNEGDTGEFNSRSLSIIENFCWFSFSADDYIENNLSLSELLIRNHLSTFLMKTSGDSMMDVGINDGDILVVDRSIEPKNRDIVIAIL